MGLFNLFGRESKKESEKELRKCMYCDLIITVEELDKEFIHGKLFPSHHNCSKLNENIGAFKCEDKEQERVRKIALAASEVYMKTPKFKEIADSVIPVYEEWIAGKTEKADKIAIIQAFKVLKKYGLE